MKILLLGAKGMLGHELQIVLKNHELTAWDKEDVDITDKNALETKINQLNPEFVINSSGYTNVEGSEDNKDTAYEINGYAVGNLARICAKSDTPLLHFSTDYVFDGTKKEPYNEDDSKNPISIYGASKALGEDLITQNTDKYFIVRTSWLYGRHGKNFVDTMLKLAAEDRKELNIVNDQTGSPTFAKDLAFGILPLLDSDNYGIYHLSGSGSCTWYEFAKAIFDIGSVDIKLNPVTSDLFPQKAKRPKNSLLKNSKLTPLPDWRDALKRYLELKQS